MARFSFETARNKDYKEVMGKEYTTREHTPEDLVKELLFLIPFEKTDFVVDAGSGIKKVWFDNIPTDNKDEVEIDEGRDFYEYDKEVDWVVGNPPFSEFIGFIFKSADISRKGFVLSFKDSYIWS